MPICDGCGAAVGSEHIRKRIERLELATRYRPVHIQTLLVGDAPPSRDEDYLYSSEKNAEELQKHGIFVVYAVECPLDDPATSTEAVRRSAGSLVKRLRFSYKPKTIVLFGPATAEAIPALREAGFSEQLILNNGAPFASLPDLEKLKNRSQD